jgi:phospholipid/cholesterol/gamma-HCH transport system substrate-binding protein
VKISNETKVGVISIVSLALLILGFNFLKGKKLWSKDTLLTARYGNVQGLQNSNPVMINGMQVGAVYKINTDKDMRRILVDMNITKDINIPENSVAVIKTNPLGTPSIEIVLGNSTTYLKHKDSIATEASTGMLSEVMGKVDPILNSAKKALGSADELLTNLNSVVDTKAKSNIDAMLGNLNKVTASMLTSTAALNALLISVNGPVSKSLKDVNGITGNFAGNNDEINSIVKNFDKTSTNVANLNLKKTLDTLDVAINNLKNLIAGFNNTKGSLGMFLNDPTLYKNLASTGNKLNLLLDDVRMNPKRYINISLFGKKKTGEVLLTPLPDTLNSPYYYVEKVK